MKNLYGFISQNLVLLRQTISYMVKNNYKTKSKRGPTEKLKRYDERRIKMEICVLQKSQDRGTASKLKKIKYSYQTIAKKCMRKRN